MNQGVEVVGVYVQDQDKAEAGGPLRHRGRRFRDPSGNGWKMIEARR